MTTALYRKNLRIVALKLFTIAGLWAVLGYAILSTTSYAVKIPLWIALGFIVNSLIQLWHDSWHGTLLNSRAQNRAFGHVASFILGTMYEPARHGHMLHHKHSRTRLDPDAYNAGRKSFKLTWQYYNVIFFGLLLSPLHFNFIYPLRYFSREKLIHHAVELTILATAYAGLAYFIVHAGLGSAALQLWIIPLCFASPWNGLKSVSDHYGDEWNGSKFRTATTTRSNGLVTFFWNGLNYHLEHHLYPQVPGYNLPKLHRLIAPELGRQNAAVFESYSSVFWGALRRGPQIIDDETDFNQLGRRVESA